MVFRRLFPSMLALAAALLPACSDDGPDAPQPEGVPARRTVLVYMAAQNSLGSRGYMDADLQELLDGRGAIADADRLLVFVDDAAPRLLRYTRQEGEPRVVRTWPADVNSTSPAVLRDVLEWTRTHYPADEYGLVMWSHADGWIPPTRRAQAMAPRPFSFGIDTGDNAPGSDEGTQMDVADMAGAIAAAGIHLDYLFFDACLMQNVEVAWQLRDVADYIIGAPIATPAAGSNYTHQLQSGLFSADPADIAATYYADVTDPAQTADYGSFGIVISAVRTDRLPALAEAVRAALPGSAMAGRQSADMDGVLNYQAYTSVYFYRPHNYDMLQAAGRVLPEAARQAVTDALDEAIVYKAATPRFYIGPGSFSAQQTVDLDRYCGMSCFVPQDVYTQRAAATPLGDLNEAFRRTAWYEAAGWAATGW